MLVRTGIESLKTIHFLRGLSDEELGKIADLCREDSFETGELCQKEGDPASRIGFICRGRVGVEFHLPGIASGSKDIILYTLSDDDVFGWPALVPGTPLSTLRALEPTNVLYVKAEDLIDLCESDNHIGYILMKHLASLIAGRLSRNRMATLNAMVSIKGEW